jgi:hypothetical protein
MEQICKNCDHTFVGKFCNNCGQKFSTPRFTFGHIYHEAFHAFTHADKGVLTLSKHLLIDAGTVAYEYIVEIRRKKYFNLFTYFLLVTAFAAFIKNKELAINEHIYHDNNQFGHIFNVYSKLLLLAAIPLLALVTWLLYKGKSKILYSEYTVFAMILMSVGSLLDAFTSVINVILTVTFKWYNGIDGNFVYPIIIAVLIAYYTQAFHKKTGSAQWWKSLLVGVAFVGIQVLINIFVIWSFIRHFEGLGVFRVFGMRFGN